MLPILGLLARGAMMAGKLAGKAVTGSAKSLGKIATGSIKGIDRLIRASAARSAKPGFSRRVTIKKYQTKFNSLKDEAVKFKDKSIDKFNSSRKKIIEKTEKTVSNAAKKIKDNVKDYSKYKIKEAESQLRSFNKKNSRISQILKNSKKLSFKPDEKKKGSLKRLKQIRKNKKLKEKQEKKLNQARANKIKSMIKSQSKDIKKEQKKDQALLNKLKYLYYTIKIHSCLATSERLQKKERKANKIYKAEYKRNTDLIDTYNNSEFDLNFKIKKLKLIRNSMIPNDYEIKLKIFAIEEKINKFKLELNSLRSKLELTDKDSDEFKKLVNTIKYKEDSIEYLKKDKLDLIQDAALKNTSIQKINDQIDEAELEVARMDTRRNEIIQKNFLNEFNFTRDKLFLEIGQRSENLQSNLYMILRQQISTMMRGREKTIESYIRLRDQMNRNSMELEDAVIQSIENSNKMETPESIINKLEDVRVEILNELEKNKNYSDNKRLEIKNEINKFSHDNVANGITNKVILDYLIAQNKSKEDKDKDRWTKKLKARKDQLKKDSSKTDGKSEEQKQKKDELNESEKARKQQEKNEKDNRKKENKLNDQKAKEEENKEKQEQQARLRDQNKAKAQETKENNSKINSNRGARYTNIEGKGRSSSLGQSWLIRIIEMISLSKILLGKTILKILRKFFPWLDKALSKLWETISYIPWICTVIYKIGKFIIWDIWYFLGQKLGDLLMAVVVNPIMNLWNLVTNSFSNLKAMISGIIPTVKALLDYLWFKLKRLKNDMMAAIGWIMTKIPFCKEKGEELIKKYADADTGLSFAGYIVKYVKDPAVHEFFRNCSKLKNQFLSDLSMGWGDLKRDLYNLFTNDHGIGDTMMSIGDVWDNPFTIDDLFNDLTKWVMDAFKLKGGNSSEPKPQETETPKPEEDKSKPPEVKPAKESTPAPKERKEELKTPDSTMTSDKSEPSDKKDDIKKVLTETKDITEKGLKAVPNMPEPKSGADSSNKVIQVTEKVVNGVKEYYNSVTGEKLDIKINKSGSTEINSNSNTYDISESDVINKLKTVSNVSIKYIGKLRPMINPLIKKYAGKMEPVINYLLDVITEMGDVKNNISEIKNNAIDSSKEIYNKSINSAKKIINEHSEEASNVIIKVIEKTKIIDKNTNISKYQLSS